MGGGELTFGETLDADTAWLAKTPPGPVGFVPAASGSEDYGAHFLDYLDQEHDREAEVIPIYRARDARRTKNCERIAACAAVYLGGGVSDHLLDALRDTPALDALATKLADGGVVVAIAAAAQALGQATRSIFRGEVLPGLGWLPATAIECNFDPTHDRRLRRLLETPGIERGLGLSAGAAVLLGPQGEVEVHGGAWVVEGVGGELVGG